MGQNYSAIVQEGDAHFDQGELDEAETRYLSIVGQKEPANASDETLLSFGRSKLQANMNLGLIHMCRGQYSQAEKYLGEAAQLEVRHSDSQRQHHVNTLAVFYLAATSCLHAKIEAEHLIQRITTSSFVNRALETRLEHASLVACARAWLLFLLDRPLPIVLAPLAHVEPHTTRITYNTIDSITPCINFEVDGELEGVEVDLDDEIGDVPSDDDLDLDDEPSGPTSPQKDKKPSPATPTKPTTAASSNGTPNFFDSKSKRANPNVELVKSIVLSSDPKIDTILVQALAQAARALGMEHGRSYYIGGVPKLYSLWKARGEALRQKERHRASLVPFIIALASNWTCLDAWVSLARAYGDSGELDLARRYLSVLTDIIAPNDIIGWLERSRICLKSGKFAEAAMCCDRVTLDIDPKSVDAWERRAFATLQLRRWSSRAIAEALEHTRAALNLDPTHTGALLTESYALLASGLHSNALAALDKLLTQAPTNAEAIHAKAVALRCARNYDSAIEWAKNSVSASPQSADVALHLAHCYLELSTERVIGHAHASSSSSSSNSPIVAPTPIPAVPKSSTPSISESESPKVGSGRAAHGMATCDPSLMPDGTFVGSLPFNQSGSDHAPTMLTIMARLHNPPKTAIVTLGLDATETALDVATRYPGFDGPSHFFSDPSYLPRTKKERYADDSEQLVKLQNQFVKSQIWASRAVLLALAHRGSEALTAADHAIEESPDYPVYALITKGDVVQLSHAKAPTPGFSTPSDSPRNISSVDTSESAAEAHSLYQRALEFDPESEAALLSIIHLLLSNNAAKEALKHSTKLAKLAAEGALQRPKLAIEVHASILFHLGQYDAAYHFALEHISNEDVNGETVPVRRDGTPEPARPSVELSRGSGSSSSSSGRNSPRDASKGNEPTSFSTIASASMDAPNDVEETYQVRLLNIAAQSLHQLGKCEESQQFFDRSLRRDPLNVYTWNEKARCLLQNRRFEDALNYFDRALVLDPADLRTICNRSLCRCLLGHLDEGAESLLALEKGSKAEEAAQWLQSLSPTERAYHFDSLSAARESKKRRDRENVAVADTDEQPDDL